MTYHQMRTGLTFGQVRAMLAAEQAELYERGQYMFITRATVLGRWHELKLSMWESYQQGRADADAGIPF